MSTITMKNMTGRRSGSYIRYEYGEDLFGFLYLDVIRLRKHRSRMVRSMLFDNPRDFICMLDLDISRKESLHYTNTGSE
ncbi:MAG: hypothetical protein KDK30_10345 [Leptospiraceae bacterium]|nr:hypothetical protein [Leptospiraceae bacterium]